MNAMDAAIFVRDVDRLFDSLNSHSKFPVGSSKYCCAITKNSLHFDLFKKMLRCIESWVFTDKASNLVIKEKMPFKSGLLQTIRGVKVVCKIRTSNDTTSQSKSRTKFIFEIRQHECAYTNPTCYQFIAALKTCISNNLASHRSPRSNCGGDCGCFRKFKSFFGSR